MCEEALGSGMVLKLSQVHKSSYSRVVVGEYDGDAVASVRLVEFFYSCVGARAYKKFVVAGWEDAVNNFSYERPHIRKVYCMIML